MIRVKERIRVFHDDGDVVVEAIGKTWRFKSHAYADLFASRAEREEDFLFLIQEHHNQHDWEKCRVNSCEGLIWQLIQGLD